jgi:hypothetical protein
MPPGMVYLAFLASGHLGKAEESSSDVQVTKRHAVTSNERVLTRIIVSKGDLELNMGSEP